MTIIRKLKVEKKSKTTASTDPTVAQDSYSTSQMSYDQRTNNMDLLISLLQSTPNYSPNEEEYKISTYQDKKAKMLQKTQVVADTFVPLNNARSTRNNTLYLLADNLVNTANKAKDYVFTILDSNSAQYKAIAKKNLKNDNPNRHCTNPTKPWLNPTRLWLDKTRHRRNRNKHRLKQIKQSPNRTSLWLTPRKQGLNRTNLRHF